MLKSLRSLIALLSIVLCFTSIAFAQERLPALSARPTDMSVSGVSSGGFMAVQLHVAHSAEFSGVGVVAGGIYWCAEGSVLLTSNPCMLYPWLVNSAIRVQKAVWEANSGTIDPVSNLAHARVYIYNSPADPVIHFSAGAKLAEFYSTFMDRNQIFQRHNLLSSHGFPTRNYGAPCGPGGYPWMLNCGFDLAGELLNQMYGDLREPKGEAVPSHLHAFNQAEFVSLYHGMSAVGHVYVPSACESGEVECRVHVALHGCGQSPAQVGDAFIAHAGYNRWAEANNMIVLYPSVLPTMANPGACWDWFGYTGPQYVTKYGLQVSAIQAMLERLKTRGDSHRSEALAQP